LTVLISTARLGRFFREVGTGVDPATYTPSPAVDEKLEHFLETAAHYGYWFATPEERRRRSARPAGRVSVERRARGPCP
jgi:hypothetical protein